MKSVNYTSYNKLDCTCDDPVIICVDESLTESGAPYIEGTLAYFSSTLDNCGRTRYNYAITYDEGQLADPDYILLESDIEGVVCKDCLYNYVQYYIDYFLENCCDQGGGDDWHILGNAGTVENTNFIGTTDNVPLSIRVNNMRCMKAIATASGPNFGPSFLNGYSGNTNNAEASAIFSGGSLNFINVIDKLDWVWPDTCGFSVIAGGYKNTMKGYMGGGSILGGYENEISTPIVASFIGSCENSVIAGGKLNKVQSSAYSGVLSGVQNIVRPNASPLIYNAFGGDVICGGGVNVIQGGDQNVISGGSNHIIQNAGSCCIGGGYSNTLGNTTAGRISSSCGIFSGRGNIVYGSDFCTVVGGNCNQITSSAQASDFRYNAILGGVRNLLADVRGSSILGGYALQLGDHSLGFEGLAFTTPVSPSQALCDDTLTNISAFDQVAYFGSVDIWVGNVDNDASKIKFFQANTSRTYTNAYYSSFQAQTQQGNIEYKWPAAAGVQGQVLKIASVAGNVLTLEWANDLT